MDLTRKVAVGEVLRAQVDSLVHGFAGYFDCARPFVSCCTNCNPVLLFVACRQVLYGDERISIHPKTLSAGL